MARRAERWRRLFRDRPLIPLIGAARALLVVLLQLARPGIVNADWVGVTIRAAVPLAILAALPDAGDADRRHRPVGRGGRLDGGVPHGDPVAGRRARSWRSLIAPRRGAVAGLVNGVGVGVFRVHPLIMTLGMGLVVLGLDGRLPAGDGPGRRRRPDVVDWLGSGTTLAFLPNNLLLFVPLAALIIVGLRRSGYGRLLFAVGDNPIAARLSGVRVWQVRSRCTSSRRCWRRIAGFLVAGLVKTASLAARRAVGAAVGGGRRHRRDLDHGRPRRLLRDDRRGADPDGPDDAADRRSRCPKRSARSCSARSSSSWPPPTPGSPASREPPRPDPPPRDRPRGHEPQVGGGRARRRRLAHARPRPGADARRRGPGRGRRRRSARSARAASSALAGASRRSGSACPGLYDPATGTTRFLVNMPGRLGRAAGRGPGRGRARHAGRADQRRPGLRARRAAARRRPRRRLDRRADARDRRRRRDRDRRAGSSSATTGRPARSATRRSIPTGRVRLRQPRLPRGVRPGGPDRRGVRDGDRRGGRGGGPGRRRAGARRAAPASAATSASGSPT